MTRYCVPEPGFVSFSHCTSATADAAHSARPPPWSVLVRGKQSAPRSLSVRAAVCNSSRATPSFRYKRKNKDQTHLKDQKKAQPLTSAREYRD